MSLWKLFRRTLFIENNLFSIICVSVITITLFICITIILNSLVKMITKIIQHKSNLKFAEKYKNQCDDEKETKNEN